MIRHCLCCARISSSDDAPPKDAKGPQPCATCRTAGCVFHYGNWKRAAACPLRAKGRRNSFKQQASAAANRAKREGRL